MKRHSLGLLAALLAVLSSVGAAAAPRVVADIGPVHSLVARVMQGVGQPTLILPPGASPHGYQMRPSEARAVAEAEVVFWVGPGLAPWLEHPIETLAEGARTEELLDAPGAVVLPLPEDDGHGHDKDNDNDHDARADGDGDAHAHHHGHIDPHAWLDPENGKRWMAFVADVLAEVDPANAARYRANAADGAAEVDSLAARIREKLAAAGDRPVVVFHNAYRYFERRFGLEPAAALLSSDAEKPGAKRLAAVEARIEAAKRDVCVLVEPQFSPRLVAAVVGAGVETFEIDPLGASIAPGPGFYPKLLDAVATAFVRCLG